MLRSDVLNPFLYNRLRAVFGDVRVACQGEIFNASWVLDPLTGRRKLMISNRGEAYCVNCPFCLSSGARRADTKKRLWIRYKWGTEFDGVFLWSLAHCYNEDCLSRPENRNLLRQMVFGSNGSAWATTYGLAEPVLGLSIPELSLPQATPLNQLPSDHPAVQYVRSRGFDENIIWDLYEVYYCDFDFRYPEAASRIILPVRDGEVLYGWVGRVVESGSSDRIRYYTAKGSRVSQTLYGINLFSDDTQVAVLVEGPLDVWALSMELRDYPTVKAAGLFGSQISLSQVNRLRQLPNLELLLVMLDGDVKDKALKVRERLLTAGFPRVEAIFLPEDKDPADWRLECIRLKESFWSKVLSCAKRVT